jgi:uncharacterized damage-inducible protein DinB
MSKAMRVLLAVAVLSGAMLAQSPDAKKNSSQQSQQSASRPEQAATVSSAIDRMFRGMEREFVDAADAMPEEKYDFAPTNGEFTGVRKFGEQVRHVAATQYMVAAAILGEKPPAQLGEGENADNGPASMTSKADIMKYLRDSFDFAHKAVNSITAANQVQPIKGPFGGPRPTSRLSLAVLLVGHGFDHYGQMVEYLRMNSIVPPASRPQPAPQQPAQPPKQ